MPTGSNQVENDIDLQIRPLPIVDEKLESIKRPCIKRSTISIKKE